MSVTFKTLNMWKYGTQPLACLTESARGLSYVFQAHIIWPTRRAPEDSAVTTVAHFTAPRTDATDATSEYAEVTKRATSAALLKFAADEAAKATFPAETIELSDIDQTDLQTWRSMGLFPGLDGASADKLGADAMRAINEMKTVYELRDVLRGAGR